MLREYGIKFCPNKPASPHLNGKVERSQKTDKIEFYATIDLPCEELDHLLAEWQHYYNWERTHSNLGGSSLMERYFEQAKEIPFLDEVLAMYDGSKERVQEQNYALDSALRKLKQSLWIVHGAESQPDMLKTPLRFLLQYKSGVLRLGSFNY